MSVFFASGVVGRVRGDGNVHLARGISVQDDTDYYTNDNGPVNWKVEPGKDCFGVRGKWVGLQLRLRICRSRRSIYVPSSGWLDRRLR